MDYDIIISAIKNASQNNAVFWKDHILQRMRQRKITVSEVLSVLKDFQIIEVYNDDKPFPSYLLMGYAEDRPLHIVAAVNAENFETHLVTVYIPDDSIWMDDYRRRK